VRGPWTGCEEAERAKGHPRRLVRGGGAGLERSCHADPTHTHAEEPVSLRPHLLYISGEDHHFRIPFMLALREHGFRVTAAGTGDSDPFLQAGLDYRPFHFHRFVNPLADLAAIKTLSRLLADLRPDLVQTCDTKPNLLVPLAARRLHDVMVVRLINGRGWIYSSRSPQALTLRPIYRALHRLAARSTAANVFEIRDDQAFFEQHRMAGKPSLVIPGWVDIKEFDRALTVRPSPAQLRDEFGLDASKVVITVTRMTRHKGIPTLLEAAALVHEARPSVRFLLVGPRESEGPLAVAQADIDRHAPYVMAIGPRSDVPALLGLADVFAFPTEYREGMPRALFEAALAGLPIVTTSMPGCANIIRDGWNGFLVPPRAPRVLAARILDLLRDRQTAQEMADRAAELVRQELGLATIVARYAALYAELLDGSGRDQFHCLPSHRILNDTYASKPETSSRL
jgi:glycosyltransferase involved in cell wall biosynthesis